MQQNEIGPDYWQSEIRRQTKEIIDLIQPLNDEQFNWKPNAKEWSAAQVIDHLNVVSTVDFPGAEKSITASASASGKTGKNWRPGFFDNILLKFLEPGLGFRPPAPKIYAPAEGGQNTVLLSLFEEYQSTSERLVDTARGSNLSRVSIKSSAGPFKFTIGGWFAIRVSHTEYHIRQLKKILTMQKFPKA